MKKRYWLAALANLLPAFPLGLGWHLVTFREAYERLALFRAEAWRDARMPAGGKLSAA